MKYYIKISKNNIKEKYNLKYLYLWLSQIEEITYILYIRFLKAFQSVENLYILSKYSNIFKKILIRNNIILSENLINKLTSCSLKENTLKIYNNLISQNIDIIHIEDEKFPKQKLAYMYNKPICLFVYGNIENLNDNVIYLHKEEFNAYGKKVCNLFERYISNKNWYVAQYFEINKGNNSLYNNYEYNYQYNYYNLKKIGIVSEDIFNLNFKLAKNIKEDKSNLYFFIHNNFSSVKEDKFNLYIIEFIVSISKICIIIQAKYDKNLKVKNIVELFLEQGKNILVVPGNICCKYNYLSNYLIKEGADIILNQSDIDKYLE